MVALDTVVQRLGANKGRMDVERREREVNLGARSVKVPQHLADFRIDLAQLVEVQRAILTDLVNDGIAAHQQIVRDALGARESLLRLHVHEGTSNNKSAVRNSPFVAWGRHEPAYSPLAGVVPRLLPGQAWAFWPRREPNSPSEKNPLHGLDCFYTSELQNGGSWPIRCLLVKE